MTVTERVTIRTRVASIVSDVVGPLPVTVALCAAGARHSSSWIAGIDWGLLAMMFAGILPYLATWRIRHPADGSLPGQRARVTYMGVAVATAAVGLAALRLLGGPAEVVRVTIAVLITLVFAAAANARWRWSNHLAAVCAGSVLLAIELGAGAAICVAAVAAVSWARLALHRHTVAELVGGAILGAGVSAVAMSLL